MGRSIFRASNRIGKSQGPIVKISVLLIEDDIVDVDVVKRTFSRFPNQLFQLTHVDRFSDAVQQLKQKRFNVILLDLGLPDNAGLNGIERVMKLAEDVPIIVLTGQDDDDMALRGIELGAQEFLCKNDVMPKTLVRAIRHAIKRKQCFLDTLGKLGDPALRDRLAKLGECVRDLHASVNSDITTLRQMGLNEEQEEVVTRIDKVADASLETANELSPASIFKPVVKDEPT